MATQFQLHAKIETHCLKHSNMIVNLDKLQLMLLPKSTKKVVQIDNNEIESENSVTLSGITIDNRLSFVDHISKLCNKGSMQLNAIFRLKKYMSQNICKLLLTVSYVLISITAPLCGTLVLINLLKKFKTYTSVVLD